MLFRFDMGTLNPPDALAQFTYAHPMYTMNLQPWPDFGENVRKDGKFFRGGATMISPSRQRVKIKKYLTYSI